MVALPEAISLICSSLDYQFTAHSYLGALSKNQLRQRDNCLADCPILREVNSIVKANPSFTFSYIIRGQAGKIY